MFAFPNQKVLIRKRNRVLSFTSDEGRRPLSLECEKAVCIGSPQLDCNICWGWEQCSPGLAQRLPQTNLCQVFVGVNNQRRICGEKKMILEEVTVQYSNAAI